MGYGRPVDTAGVSSNISAGMRVPGWTNNVLTATINRFNEPSKMRMAQNSTMLAKEQAAKEAMKEAGVNHDVEAAFSGSLAWRKNNKKTPQDRAKVASYSDSGSRWIVIG